MAEDGRTDVCESLTAGRKILIREKPEQTDWTDSSWELEEGSWIKDVKGRRMVGGARWTVLKKFSWWSQDFKTGCKRTRGAERRMKEGRDEKNNKGELKRVLKMASEQMRRWRLWRRERDADESDRKYNQDLKDRRKNRRKVTTRDKQTDWKPSSRV